MQYVHDLMACRPVGTEPAGKECRMRTASSRFMHRHGRADAEDACLVRGGGDYSALTETAHNDGLPAERWLVALLDRREEGIEVEVEH